MKRVCEKLAIPRDGLLYGTPEIDDAEYRGRRLKRLPPAQSSGAEAFFNQTLALFKRSGEYRGEAKPPFTAYMAANGGFLRLFAARLGVCHAFVLFASLQKQDAKL